MFTCTTNHPQARSSRTARDVLVQASTPGPSVATWSAREAWWLEPPLRVEVAGPIRDLPRPLVELIQTQAARRYEWALREARIAVGITMQVVADELGLGSTASQNSNVESTTTQLSPTDTSCGLSRASAA